LRRVLIVGRTRYRLPLPEALEAKFAALRREFDVRILASGPTCDRGGDERFVLVRPFAVRALDGLVFWSTLPARVLVELRRFRPEAVIAQSPYEGAASLLARVVSRSDAKVLVEVHGDWRTATRLYGSRWRRLLAPVADRVALAAVRRADGLRAVSGYAARLVEEAGRKADDVFSAFMLLDPFEREPVPLPSRPQALFVGVLELYKNVDGLADAWRLAAREVPGARLVVVGAGARAPLVERLVAELPEQTCRERTLTPDGVANALDESTLLVLPSRSEGMGRVVVEAMSRGRAVVATRVGGLEELVDDGRTGVLVAPGDTRALADALARLLSDRALAERLGAAARAAAESHRVTPEEFASHLRTFVEQICSRA
jgi:glycosyltransferase involved in cell wall biosynthesis